jgi:hypothetical protein
MNEIAVKACRKVNDYNNLFSTGGIGGSKYTEFKTGETYELPDPEKLELCEYGFHYFRKEDLCFGINLFEEETVFIEIEVLGEVVFDTYKRCTNKFKVLQYIPKKEWEKLIKENDNSGWRNSGFRNSGDCNSGNYNSGSYNSGKLNSGNYNSGNYNSGYYNSGNYNSGSNNSGYFNSGHNNSGFYNSGNGYLNKFCRQTKYFLFDQEVSKSSYEKISFNMSWFSLENKSYKKAWKSCPKEVLDTIKEFPEFQTENAKIAFKEITGLDLELV